MKNQVKPIAFLMAIIISVSFGASAQYVVKVRPARPTVVVVPPHRPGRSHIWVDGNWIWRGGHYTWVDGYWLAPRSGYYWRNGYWKHHRGGYVWVSGNWKRR